MTRHDRAARRLVCCSVCHYDRNYAYRDETGTITIVCSSCGHEMLRAQGEPAPAP